MCKVLIALENGVYNGKPVKIGDIVEVEDPDKERRYCETIRNLVRRGPRFKVEGVIISQHLIVCRSCRAWNDDREAANGLQRKRLVFVDV